MAGRATEAWQWWIDGLVDAVLMAEARLRRVPPIRLAPVPGGHAIVHADGRLGRRVLTAGTGGIEPKRLARRFAGRIVEIGVAPEEMVRRRLGPFPAESRPYIDGIVTHQLERMTPWLAADTLSSRRIEPVGPDDPRLMVTVDATSRALHAASVAAFAAAEPKELRLVRPAGNGDAEVVLPIAAANADERKRIGVTVRLALAALALAAVAGSWAYFSAADEIEARLVEVVGRIGDFERRLGPVTGAGASDRDLIATLSRETPMAVIALDNLSGALPDDTHLTALRIARGKLRMSGVTRDIATLTTTIEASESFSDPVFPAPTTRGADGDRFTLVLDVADGGRTKR
jgi:general secretion pathway protein L